jgi:CheY-like chemotaxis protein
MLWHIGGDGDHRRVDCRAQVGFQRLTRRDKRSMADGGRSGPRSSFKSGYPRVARDGSRQRLEMAGADVAPPVSTEKQTLKVIEDGDFDCALLDGNLHGRPVDEIAAALTRRKIPFVFITGYGRTGLPTSFQQAPVLSKPLNDEQLFDAIIGIASRPRKIFPLKP